MNIEITISTKHAYTPSQISDLFVGFIEGNYMTAQWVYGGIFPEKIGEYPAEKRLVWYGHAEAFSIPDWSVRVEYDDPNSKNGEGNSEGRFTITPETFAAGLALMAEKQPELYKQIHEESADIIGYDVLLQMIVLKEVVYG